MEEVLGIMIGVSFSGMLIDLPHSLIDHLSLAKNSDLTTRTHCKALTIPNEPSKQNPSSFTETPAHAGQFSAVDQTGS
jgi:hypothetical protein